MNSRSGVVPGSRTYLALIPISIRKRSVERSISSIRGTETCAHSVPRMPSTAR
jgi:hypothetical protein